MRRLERQVQLQVEIDADEARDVFRAFDVARHPVDRVGHAAQQRAGFQRSYARLSCGAPGASTQVSLLPPPCDEFTTSDPLRKRHARQPAREHVDLLAIENVRPQVHVAALEVVVHQGRNARQRQRRLGDVISRVGFDLAGELLALLCAVECGPTSMPYPPDSLAPSPPACPGSRARACGPVPASTGRSARWAEWDPRLRSSGSSWAHRRRPPCRPPRRCRARWPAPRVPAR